MTPETKLEGGSSSKRIKHGQANKRPIKWGHKVFSQLTVIWTNPKDRKFRTHLSSEAWPNLLILWPLSACPLQPPPTHTDRHTHTPETDHCNTTIKWRCTIRKEKIRQDKMGYHPQTFPLLVSNDEDLRIISSSSHTSQGGGHRHSTWPIPASKCAMWTADFSGKQSETADCWLRSNWGSYDSWVASTHLKTKCQLEWLF